jgi:glutamyl-tRNA synthetase
MRLSFVNDPIELHVQNASPKEVLLKNHPNADLGIRKVSVSDSFYLTGDDAAKLNIGDEIRLMDLYNIQVTKIITSENHKQILIAHSTGDDIRQNMPKIHWVAKNDVIPYKVMMARELYMGEEYNTNSLEIFEGFAESFVSTLKPDTRIQFVRFGFCRLDGNNTAIFTHR